MQTTRIYNVLKVAEGGIGQREAIAIAKQYGATKAVGQSSGYVGQTALAVTASERNHRRIEDALYSY